MADKKTTYQVWWCAHDGREYIRHNNYIHRESMLFECKGIHEAIDWITKFIAFPEIRKGAVGYAFSGNGYAAAIYEAVDGDIVEKFIYAKARSTKWPPQLPAKSKAK